MKLFSFVAASILLTAVSASPQTANAQSQSHLEQAQAFAQNIPWQGIGQSALERARRSVALGPFVGLAGVGGGDRDLDGALSFGLALWRFDVPIVPDRAEIEGILKERFKKIFMEKLAEAMRGNLDGSNIDAKQIAKAAWNDVLEAYIKGRRNRVLEDPGFRFHVEGTRLFAADVWQARGTVGAGIAGVSLALSFGGEFGDDNFAFLGLEVTKPLVFGEARTPVIDLLVRVERGFGEGHNDLSYSSGARLLLDIL
jgi:hypothetical protein